MKQVVIYSLVAFLLIACNRNSSKKAFALKKDDFTFYTSEVNPFQQKIVKYPEAVYSFGTCTDSILYKGLYVNEYTTDCNDPENFLEETFLLFLDSNRVYYYSKGRKSKELSNFENVSESINRPPIIRGTKPVGSTTEIDLESDNADYQRRGYYEIRKCSNIGFVDESSNNNELTNRIPIAGPLISPKDRINNRLITSSTSTKSNNYNDTGYCLYIEIERPINFRKSKKAKRKIRNCKPEPIIDKPDQIVSIADTSIIKRHSYTISPSPRIIERRAKDEIIAKHADKVYMGFRILEEKLTNKLVLKLENLTKPNNRSRILGAVESRTIFADQTFRKQVVFYPRLRENLNIDVLIKGSLYNEESQISKLSW